MLTTRGRRTSVRSVLSCLVLASVAHPVPASAGWIELRSRRIVIVGDASEGQARECMRRLQLLRALFESRGARVDPGKELVAYAMRDRRSLRDLLEGLAQQRPSGLFIPGENRDVVAMRVERKAGLYPCAIGLHEYAHVLQRLNYAQLPVWLNEGLAELYATLSGTPQRIRWGALLDERVAALRTTREVADIRPDRDQVAEAIDSGWRPRWQIPRPRGRLRRRLLTLDELFAVTRQSDPYLDSHQSDVFYAEAAALTHLLLSEGTSPVARFVEDPASGPLPGVAPRVEPSPELEDSLRLHVRRGIYRPFEFEIDASLPEPEVRRLDVRETAARKADFLLRAGLSSRARDTLERARGRGNPPPLALEVLGAILTRANEPDAAFAVYVRAVRGPSPSVAALFGLGRLALRSGRDSWTETGAAALLGAVQAAPTFAAAHAELARWLMKSPDSIVRGCRHAKRAAQEAPGELIFAADQLRCLARRGDVAGATRVAALLDDADPAVPGAAIALAEAAALSGNETRLRAVLTQSPAWSDAELQEAAAFHRRAGRPEVAQRLLDAAAQVRFHSAEPRADGSSRSSG